MRSLAWLLVLVAGAAGCNRQAGLPVPTETAVLAVGGASNPTAAISPAGAAYVSWVAIAAGESNVLLARAGAAGEFSAPVRVNDLPGDAAPHPQAPAQVAVGPRGEVYVAWQVQRQVEGREYPASDLRFARSLDGGRSFGPALFVNDDAGGPPASHTFHELAVAPDGTVYVSWIDGRAKRAAAAPATGGHEHHDHGEGNPEIRVARSRDGGRSFEPGRVVAAGACPCCRTALATGPAGELYVAWRQVHADGARDIVVARSHDHAATFSSPVTVHRDAWAIAGCPHAGPALAVSPTGQVHVAWYTGAEGRAGAYYAVGQNGQDFSAPVRLTAARDAPTTQVSLAADHADVWVAWEDHGASGTNLRLARARSSRRPRPAAGVTEVAKLPALAARDGRVVLAGLAGDTVRVVRIHAPANRAFRSPRPRPVSSKSTGGPQ